MLSLRLRASSGCLSWHCRPKAHFPATKAKQTLPTSKKAQDAPRSETPAPCPTSQWGLVDAPRASA